MTSEPPAGPSRLSRIETLWSVVHRAHQSSTESAREAQERLLEMYGGAIRRYLIGALKDVDQADELFQEFALKFVSGGFSTAAPEKGRFRSFVKTILYRMVAQHFREKSRRREQGLPAETDGQATNEQLGDEADEAFLISWREQLLERTWGTLADHEASTGVPYHTVLAIRTSDPTLTSEELASKLTERLGKPIAPGAARVLVHRARDKFANFLIDVTAESLQTKDLADVESELIDLRLMVYCQGVFGQRSAEKKTNEL